jgi:AraC-like DNA-binding protein
MILITFDLIGAYLDISETIRQFPRLYNFNTSFPFLYAPIVFLYIGAISGRIKSFRKRDILHILPFIAHIVIYSPLLSASTSSQYILLSENSMENATIQILPDYPALILQVAVYHFLILRTIIAYKKNMTADRPGTGKRIFPWMILVVSISLFSWVSFFSSMFSGSIQQYVYEILFTVVIYVAAYKLMSMPEIFSKDASAKEDPPSGSTDARQTQEQLIERFTGYIETSKAYLEPDITIGNICDRIGAPVHRISRALNKQTHKNFYFIINEYRAAEAKRKLLDKNLSEKSVLSIGLDSGFNSKSSFNDVFKKITGVTPTEFRGKGCEQQASE